LVAALGIITLVVLLIVLVLLLVLPLLGGQLGALIQNIPTYVTKLRALISDPGIPWLNKLVGSGIGSDKGISDLVTQGAGWVTTFLTGLWSGGRAIVSLFSLIVVTPVVAFYLLYDWHRMVNTVDSWIPIRQRDTVHELVHETDRAIAGFVRGQAAVCVILGTFYAVALTLTGLNFGLLIGLISGLITFIPYVGSMTGLVLSVGVAVDHCRRRHLLRRAVHRGQHPVAEAGWRKRRPAPGLGDLRAARLRLPVRLRRPAGRGAGGGDHRRAGALRSQTLPR
jgi:predicted PurR-regulated permease PerM